MLLVCSFDGARACAFLPAGVFDVGFEVWTRAFVGRSKTGTAVGKMDTNLKEPTARIFWTTDGDVPPPPSERDDQTNRRTKSSAKVIPLNENGKKQSVDQNDDVVRKGHNKVKLKVIKVIKLLFVAALTIVLGGLVYLQIEAWAVTEKIQSQKDLAKSLKQYFKHNETALQYLLGHKLTGPLLDEETIDKPLDLQSCIFFTFTLATTIGYGSYFPLTAGGKVFAVVYSLIVIPIGGSILVAIAETALEFFKYLYSLTINKAKRTFKQFDKDNTGFLDAAEMKTAFEELDLPTISQQEFDELMLRIDTDHDSMISLPEFERAVKLLALDLGGLSEKDEMKVLVFAIAIWMGCGSLVFSLIEEWSIGDAFYFVFISLSTVGLGDITPTHLGSLIFLYLFTIVGLGLLAVFINLLSVVAQKAHKHAKEVARIAKLKAEQQANNYLKASE